MGLSWSDPPFNLDLGWVASVNDYLLDYQSDKSKEHIPVLQYIDYSYLTY